MRSNGRRAAKVLEKLKGFDGKNPPRAATRGSKVGRGISLSECFRSFVGQLADVEVVDKGNGQKEIHVSRVYAVVDCGFAIDPRNVEAHVRSAINFGLSTALYGEVDIDQGRIVPKNFDDHRIVGPHDAPEISVDLENSRSSLGGVGEIATPGIAPAVGNAVFNAIRKRLRSLPLRRSTRQKDPPAQATHACPPSSPART